MGKRIVISNAIETVEDADRALQYLERDIADPAFALQGLDVFSGPVCRGASLSKAIPFLVEDKRELLHTIGMQPVQCGFGFVRLGVPFYSGDHSSSVWFSANFSMASVRAVEMAPSIE